MPTLCTYRLNWARRTSWRWWDDWDDTVLQTQDSKFEPWWSEAEHATSRSRRLPTILTVTRGWGRNIFSFFQIAETGNRAPNSGVKVSGANHYPRTPGPRPLYGAEVWGRESYDILERLQLRFCDYGICKQIYLRKHDVPTFLALSISRGVVTLKTVVHGCICFEIPDSHILHSMGFCSAHLSSFCCNPSSSVNI